MEKEFIDLINKGELINIQNFYETKLVNIPVDFENIFFEACVFGNLPVVKWLYKIYS